MLYDFFDGWLSGEVGNTVKLHLILLLVIWLFLKSRRFA